MDFTREPIIETIVTPREGFKLALRSSKGIGQEEYFVEAVEIVSFGTALFFRSLERPKCFMVPVTDYEILEVREARMVLKNVGVDSTIKIAGGRDGAEGRREQRPRQPAREAVERPAEVEENASLAKAAPTGEARPEKKRERRRQGRRRRGGREERNETGSREQGQETEEFAELGGEGQEGISQERVMLPPPRPVEDVRERREGMSIASILPPPTKLISETLDRYREDELFKGVFHLPKPEEASPEDIRIELSHIIPEVAEVVLEPAKMLTVSETTAEAMTQMPTISQDEPPKE